MPLHVYQYVAFLLNICTLSFRSLKDKQCELDEAKVNLVDITDEIAKVHECIDTSHYADLTSIDSSPRRSKDVRSSGHSVTRRVHSEKRSSGKLLLLDHLPEAEGMGHDNALKQLGHIRKSVLEYKMYVYLPSLSCFQSRV